MQKCIILLLSLMAYQSKAHDHNTQGLIGFAQNNTGCTKFYVCHIEPTPCSHAVVALHGSSEIFDEEKLNEIADFFVPTAHEQDLPLQKSNYENILDLLELTPEQRPGAFVVASILISKSKLSTTHISHDEHEARIFGHGRTFADLTETYFVRSSMHNYIHKSGMHTSTSEVAQEIQQQHPGEPFHIIFDLQTWKEQCSQGDHESLAP